MTARVVDTVGVAVGIESDVPGLVAQVEAAMADAVRKALAAGAAPTDHALLLAAQLEARDRVLAGVNG